MPSEWKNWFVPGNTHNALAHMLLKFAEKEYSPENLLCWLAIEDYLGRRTIAPSFPSGTHPKQKLAAIYATFLQKGAPREVNTRRAHCDKVLQCLQEGRSDARAPLIDIQRDMATNVGDTYSRFIFTDDYKNYLTQYNWLRGGYLKQGVRDLAKKLGGTGKKTHLHGFKEYQL